MLSGRRWIRGIISLAMLWLALPACIGFSTDEAPTPTPGATETASPGPALTETPEPTEPPESGGTLIVALPAEPDSLNFTLTDQQASLWAISTLDARLIRVRDDGTLEPQLLTEIPAIDNGGISEDGTTYTIHFRPDLEWSDGEPLDAEDFLFTWQTITNRAYPAVAPGEWSLIERVALSDDDLTATIYLEQPSATFLDHVLAGSGASPGGLILPAHVFEDVDPAEIADHPYGAEGHVGSGPFRVAKWDPGEQLVVERNEHFSGPEARLDRIVFRFVASPRDAISFLTTGEVDLAAHLPETALPDLPQLSDASALLTPIAGGVEMLGFNLNDPGNLAAPHPILSDPSVRMAIALGFNRRAIVQDLLLDQTTVATSPLDHTPWRAEDLSAYPYDPREASQILDEAGWATGPDGIRSRDGTRLSISYTTTVDDDPDAALRRQIQAAFIKDMQAIGIEVRERNIAPGEFPEAGAEEAVRANRQFDLIDLDAHSSQPLDALAWRFSSERIPSPDDPDGGNLMGYDNPVVDGLLTAQAREMDPARRQEMIARIQQHIHDDLMVIPIYDHLEIDVRLRYVEGLAPGPQSGLWWNPEEWWVNRKTATP